mmetsp:Transcript_27950/g.90125  ORF Transcript_27950/g.90125 Transcript_27950/m.90125 type:complete len:218 (-) Transcript_27950:330-983(-)
MVSAARAKRGIFVVFEGVDRSGKSTQCGLLVESLREKGRSAALRRYPERSTAIGGVIDGYLKREVDLDDRAVHLLFSANRWETQSDLRAQLLAGVDVVCDRYAFSGVAFSAAKDSMDVDWCKAPDQGLIAPDVVVYLVLSNDDARKRAGFGGERYEVDDIQRQVASNFKSLQSDNWHVVDAARDVDQVKQDIDAIVNKVIEEHLSLEDGDDDLPTLW